MNCCGLVTNSRLTLCYSMDWSILGFPVLHYLPVCSSSCPLSRWCIPTISSSATTFSFCLQSFPASGSFPVDQLFASGGQSIGTSVSVLPMNIQGWFSLELTGWISLQSKGLSRVFYSTEIPKASVLQCLAFFIFQLSHLYITTGKTIALTIQMFVAKWCLCFTVWYLVCHGFPSKEHMS